jgi:hypothetical protein
MPTWAWCLVVAAALLAGAGIAYVALMVYLLLGLRQ